MKHFVCFLCSVVPALILALSFSAAGFAQGTLTPPGAPAPTMRTLDQVEPRTIVNATNTPGDAANSFIISKSGSYYLVGNITGVAGKNGISIQAADVTLDLNGFTLTGPGSGGNDTTGLRGVVTFATATNSCIRDGSVRNWYGGVEASAAGLLVEKLRLSGNISGLSLGNGSIARDCVASGNTTGFLCDDRTQLTNCIASENAGAGFEGTNYVVLLDCTASRNEAFGFRVGSSCSLTRCSATRTNGTGSVVDPGDGTGYGIMAGDGCNIVQCTASNNKADGIRAMGPKLFGGTISNCAANENDGIGISTRESVITGSAANHNGGDGINNTGGSVSNCTANHNGAIGMSVREGSTTNSTASFNLSLGIDGYAGVIAFCRAFGNQRGFESTGTTLTGNNPAL